MAKQKKKKQNQSPENNSNPNKSESGKSTKNSDGTYSYKREDGTKVTFDPSKRGRNSRGQFTNESVNTSKKKSSKEAKEEKALKVRVTDLTKTKSEHEELSETLHNKYTDNEKAIVEAKKRGLGDEVQRLRSKRENIKDLIKILDDSDPVEKQIEQNTITENKLYEYKMSELTKLRDDLGITNQDLEELEGAEYRDLSKKAGLVDALVEYSAKQESEREEARIREREREETPEEASERWATDPLEIGKRAKDIGDKAKAITEEVKRSVANHPQVEKAKKIFNDITESKTFVEGNYKLKDPVSAYKEAFQAMPDDAKLLFAQTVMDVAMGDVGELTGALALEATKTRKELTTALKEKRYGDAASILYDVSKPAQKQVIKSQLKRALKTAVQKIGNNALKTTVKTHGLLGAMTVAGGDIGIAYLSALKDKYDNKRKEKAQTENAESIDATSE